MSTTTTKKKYEQKSNTHELENKYKYRNLLNYQEEYTEEYLTVSCFRKQVIFGLIIENYIVKCIGILFFDLRKKICLKCVIRNPFISRIQQTKIDIGFELQLNVRFEINNFEAIFSIIGIIQIVRI